MSNPNSVKFKKIEDRKYAISFLLENNGIDNSTINDFFLIELLYKVNHDNFIDGTIQYNDTNGVMYVLIKPICKELGFNNRYIYLSLEKQKQDNKTYIQCTPIDVSTLHLIDEKYHHYLKDPSILSTSLSKMNITIHKTNKHQMVVDLVFSLEPSFYIFPLFETILKMFLKKIFKNLQMYYLMIT